MATTKKKPSAKAKKAKRVPEVSTNDGGFLLKLVMYIVVGTQWLHIESGNGSLPIPLGLLIGLLFATHEHFRLDRKIEYAVLVAATLVGFYANVGLIVTL